MPTSRLPVVSIVRLPCRAYRVLSVGNVGAVCAMLEYQSLSAAGTGHALALVPLSSSGPARRRISFCLGLQTAVGTLAITPAAAATFWLDARSSGRVERASRPLIDDVCSSYA